MNLSLTDMVRNNDRNNTLVVMDVNIPQGNISYSGLNSKIDKTEIRFSDVYMLQAENRGYNTGQSFELLGSYPSTTITMLNLMGIVVCASLAVVTHFSFYRERS